MQKWEYLCIEGHHSSNKKIAVTRENFNLVEGRPNIVEYLNKLGAEGWELVNCFASEYGETKTSYYFLKRESGL